MSEKARAHQTLVDTGSILIVSLYVNIQILPIFIESFGGKSCLDLHLKKWFLSTFYSVPLEKISLY